MNELKENLMEFCLSVVNDRGIKLLDKKGIYMIVNIVNGKKYIGLTYKSFRERIRRHISELKRGVHSNRHLSFSWSKYGDDAFSFCILEHFEKEDEVDLFSLEKQYIKEYHSFKNGYNLTKGGEGALGLIVSEETRQKQSLAKKGKDPWNKGVRGHFVTSEETKQKISSANSGVRFGEKHSQAELTENDVINICERLITGESIRSIGEDYTVNQVRHIKYGNSWTHISKDYIDKFDSPRKELQDRKKKITKEQVEDLYAKLGNKKKVAKELEVGVLFINKILRGDV